MACLPLRIQSVAEPNFDLECVRLNARHKLAIVQALQDNGEIVSMTGRLSIPLRGRSCIADAYLRFLF